MAVTTFPSPITVCRLPNINVTPQNPTGTALTGSGMYVAIITDPPKSGAIHKIHFRTSAFTSSGDAEARIETVDATTGLPTGTLYATNANGTVTVTATNTWFSVTLTADPTVAPGPAAKIAIMVKWNSGSWTIGATRSGNNGQLPYRVINTGTPTKGTSGDLPNIVIEYADGTFGYIPGSMPGVMVSANYQNASGIQEIGNSWTPVFAYRVVGVDVYANETNDYDVILYGTDGTTVLATAHFDKDVVASATGTIELLFDNQPIVVAGSTYTIVFKVLNATNAPFVTLTPFSAAARTSTSFGTNFQKATRTTAGSGAFTLTSTDLMLLAPMADGIDVAAVTATATLMMVE